MDVKQRTAQSFAYEWERFGVSPLEMAENFQGYFQFFPLEFFSGKRVLEAGSGMGRHTFFLAQSAREVVALDLGDAIYVTARNVGRRANTHFLKADIDHLPLLRESFDFICSIGVLHHLPQPEAGFNRLLTCLKPGGTIHVYLYWSLEGAPLWKRALLGLITQIRRVTTRLPYPLLEKIAWLTAVVGFTFFSIPYRYLSRWQRTRAFAETLPLKRYAALGFRVCYNDQFDRLSAPIENRYTRAQVEAWFARAGLSHVRIEPHYGWLACGTKKEN